MATSVHGIHLLSLCQDGMNTQLICRDRYRHTFMMTGLKQMIKKKSNIYISDLCLPSCFWILLILLCT